MQCRSGSVTDTEIATTGVTTVAMTAVTTAGLIAVEQQRGRGMYDMVDVSTAKRI